MHRQNSQALLQPIIEFSPTAIVESRPHDSIKRGHIGLSFTTRTQLRVKLLSSVWFEGGIDPTILARSIHASLVHITNHSNEGINAVNRTECIPLESLQKHYGSAINDPHDLEMASNSLLVTRALRTCLEKEGPIAIPMHGASLICLPVEYFVQKDRDSQMCADECKAEGSVIGTLQTQGILCAISIVPTRQITAMERSEGAGTGLFDHETKRRSDLTCVSLNFRHLEEISVEESSLTVHSVEVILLYLYTMIEYILYPFSKKKCFLYFFKKKSNI